MNHIDEKHDKMAKHSFTWRAKDRESSAKGDFREKECGTALILTQLYSHS